MNHPINPQSILGDYRGFYASVRQQLLDVDIDVTGTRLSHLAFRTASVDEYIEVREALRELCVAEVENVWNGRPINKMLLARPLQLDESTSVPMIELIPTPHQNNYPMGMEHLGFVLGFGYDTFAERHEAVLSGQLDNGPYCRPWYITLPDGSCAKFYRYSLKDVVELEGRRFEPYTAEVA